MPRMLYWPYELGPLPLFSRFSSRRCFTVVPLLRAPMLRLVEALDNYEGAVSQPH